MNYTGEFEGCYKEKLLRTSEGLKTFYLGFVAVGVIIMVVSLVGWIMLRRKSYIKYRQPPLIFLLCIGWIFNLVVGPLHRGMFSKTDYYLAETDEEREFELGKIEKELYFFHNCVFDQILFHSIVSIISWIQFVRIWQIFQKVKFNKFLALHTEQNAKLFHINLRKKKEIGSSHSSIVSLTSTKLRRSKLLLSKEFAFLIASVGIICSCLYSLWIASDICPELGEDQCKINIADVSSKRTFVLNIAPGIFFIIFFLYVLHVTKKYPDPFKFFLEIKQAYVVCLLLMLLGAALDSFDPLGNFQEDSGKIIYFDYAIIIDLGINWYCFRSITVPILITLYKKYFAWKGEKVVSSFENQISFSELLEHEDGIRLFRAHLQFEFSSENLDFYLTAKEWKDNFYMDLENERKKQYAINIYNRWLKPNGVSPVNVPFSIQNAIYEKLEANSPVEATLFNSAIQEIYMLMQNDSFSRFREKQDFCLSLDASHAKRVSL
eukprot:snap_masked-scaffold_16-processed-gene-5.25-mRNA-1 protein AED:1.00 eAED:1.00 QI:0/-1/0/0/-1/1/1/0/490